ncbi:hypothetical protein, partial [Niveispirillum sp. BGYR6]|uniref:hypothetical protein n=1 Tax=Niveispirillum sp. BGYR6 TaxID=2971249 RepID=UPI0022B97E38
RNLPPHSRRHPHRLTQNTNRRLKSPKTKPRRISTGFVSSLKGQTGDGLALLLIYSVASIAGANIRWLGFTRPVPRGGSRRRTKRRCVHLIAAWYYRRPKA